MIYATYEKYKELWDLLKLQPDESKREYNMLEAAYEAPARHYHTLEHVDNCLRVLNSIAALRGLSRKDCLLIEWSIWYHDYYNTGSQDDEENSARVATRLLSIFESPDPNGLSAQKVRRLIYATRHDKVPADIDISIMCDCDLSILGSDPLTYGNYARNIRKEYSHVPDSLYAVARIAVLEKFNRHYIYYTKQARETFEAQAIRNMRHESDALFELAQRGC